MIMENPLDIPPDDVIFSPYAIQNGITQKAFEQEKRSFFKGIGSHSVVSAAKRYGWGVHSNPDGKIDIYAWNLKNM